MSDTGMTSTFSLRAVVRGKLFRIALASVFTVFIAVLVIRQVSVDVLGDIVRRLDIGLALMTLMVYIGLVAVRARRFILVGARVSFESAFQIAAVHAALLRVMPLRSGELAYAILLKRGGGGSIGEGVAALLIMRVLDLAAVLPLVSIAVVVLVAGVKSALAAGAVCLVGFAFGAIFFGAKPLLMKLRALLSGQGGHPLRDKGASLIGKLVEAYNIPLKRRIALLLWTVLLWVVLLVWMSLVFLAIGAVSLPSHGFAAGALGVLGSTLPVSLFGTFGPMEGGAAVGLVALGQTHSVALAGAIVASMMTFICNWTVAIPCWVAFLLADGKGTSNADGSAKTRAMIRRALGSLLFACLGAAILLVRLRYGFETSDQLQYLLLPYRHIFEDFLIGDWFTWKTTHYHVAFSWFIRGLHGIFGPDGFPVAVFATQVAVLMALSYAALRLARSGGYGWISAATGLLVVAFIRNLGIGETPIHGTLLPADMALPPFLLGCALWIEQRRLSAGLMLGLSGLLHANFAVLGPLVVAVPEMVSLVRTRRLMPSVRLALGYLVVAWPTLAVSVLSFFTADSAPGALEVLFKIRSPHHYDPPFANSADIWWVMALLVAALPVWLRPEDENESRSRLILLSLIGTQVVAALATLLDIGFLVRLFLWRLSVPLILLSAIAMGRSAVRAVAQGDLPRILYAAAAFVLVASFSASGEVRLQPDIRFSGFGGMIPALLPLAAAAIAWRFGRGRALRATAALLSVGVLIWAVTLCVPNVVVPAGRALDWRTAVTRWQKFTDLNRAQIMGEIPVKRLYKWIQSNTPKNATFLIPPGHDGFRFWARRGIFVDWKCCPMKGSEVLEWQRRMLAAMGTEDFPAKGYALYDIANRRFRRRSLASLAALARKEGITHIMTSLKPDTDASKAGLEKLTRKDGFTVYRVRAISPHPPVSVD